MEVFHGPQVEVRENCFVEGAWDGPFPDFDFDQASTLAGSGARLRDGQVIFCGPSHMCERFQSVRVGEELFISNSLALLIALSGERLDPNYPHYYWDFLDFRRIGIRQTRKRIRLLGSGFLDLHDCCNLRVGVDLSATRLEKPAGTAPRDFAAYRSYLERTLAAVTANARHPDRRWSYRPVAMVSQGYDSTAVAALAGRAGCREAVTFRRSGGKRGYENDSGMAIAAALGLGATEYERMDFENLPEYREDEFYIEPWGTDRHIVAMEKQVAGSLLLSGREAENLWPIAGGGCWGILSDTGRPYRQNADTMHLGGFALGEFRRRVGFLDFPLASSGAIHAAAIHAIGRSKEMTPWSTGGYDKPIPRRIAEEAGVPRHLFGQTKKGGPAWPVSTRQTRIGKYRDKLGHWAQWRVAGLRLLGNRLHPRWREGSFAVQQLLNRAIERYQPALSEIEFRRS